MPLVVLNHEAHDDRNHQAHEQLKTNTKTFVFLRETKRVFAA